MRSTPSLAPAIAVALGLMLTACASGEIVTAEAGSPQETTSTTSPPTTEGSTPEPTITGGPDVDAEAAEPPPVVVTRGEDRLELTAWGYCWTPPTGDVGICADGAPPAEPAVLTGDGPIQVFFAGDFQFSVTSYDETYSDLVDGATITPVDGTWVVDPGPANPTVFEVFGVGPEGDVIVTFALG